MSGCLSSIQASDLTFIISLDSGSQVTEPFSFNLVLGSTPVLQLTGTTTASSSPASFPPGAIAAIVVVIVIIVVAGGIAIFLVLRKRKSESGPVEVLEARPKNNYASTEEVLSPEARKKAKEKEDEKRKSHYDTISAVNKEEVLFKFLVAFSDIEMGEKLGQGSFGVVNRAKYKNQDVACKMLNSAEANTNDFLNEAKVMSQITDHPNVVRLIGFCRDPVCILSGEFANPLHLPH